LASRRRILEPDGTLVGVGSANNDGTASIAAGLLQTAVMSRFGNQKMPFFLAKNSKDDLLFLKDLIEAGKVRPVVDRTYPLTETAEAMRYLETGHARAKVVITV
jgi:NADPH:quinone reductase-like Zn-dependent oxidoreductase